MKNTVVLWTGGKDSCLALHEVKESGRPITGLVTFAPRNENFQAHPIPLMKAQAQSLGLPHTIFHVEEPYWEGYLKALEKIKNEMNVGAVVTGDIDLVEGQPNWISECCAQVGLEVLLPLWKRERLKVMDDLLNKNIRALITHLNDKKCPASWRGRTLDQKLLDEMKGFKKDSPAFDLAGENGEYHTMVSDAPLFRGPVDLGPALS